MSEASTGYVSSVSSTSTCYYYYGKVKYVGSMHTSVYDYIYHDPLGGLHPFSGVSNLWSGNGNGGCTLGKNNGVTAVATDGSGYTFNANMNTGTLTAVDGTVYSSPFNAQIGSGTVADTNGNQLTASYSGGTTTFMDTLGVTALTVSGAGTPASPMAYAYPNPSGGTSQVTVNYTAYTVGTNFGCSGVSEFKPAMENLISSIGFPDGTSYSFTYDSAGRVTSVTLPTGGTIHYAYSGGNSGIICADGSTATLTRTMPDGSEWTYTHAESGSNWTTTVTDPQGNQTVYQFQGIYQTERKVYQGSSSSGTLLETVDTCYNGSSSPCTGTAVNLPITQRSVTVTIPGVAPAETVTDYNGYGLPTETEAYDYGPTLVRKTVITYASPGNNVEDRPSSVQVYNGSGGLAAQSTYAYDSHGNLTTLTESVTGSSTISRSFTYTANGMVATATDFDGNATSFSYGSGSCNGAFPTSIAQPLSLTSSLAWSCNGGAVTSVTDPNGETTGFSYDEMWRPTVTSYPGGGSSTLDYSSATKLDLYTALTSSTSRHDETLLDSLGRTSQQILVSDPAGADTVATSYDALGRVASVTNPFRGTSPPPNDSTSYGYDALGRVTSVTYADGSQATTSYSGNCATSTDPAGKKRELCSNALGEVTEVIEDPSGANYVTSYTYDTLGNLVTVSQGQQTRTYSYDMLGRLTSATTPESGATSYSYLTSGGALCSGDASNVCIRTDARGVKTTYSYDALNRLTSKSYANDLSHTPTARYFYDGPPPGLVGWSGTFSNQLGRLGGTCTVPAGNSQCSQYSTATVNTYDPMGRVISFAQCTPYNCGTSFWFMTYNYDLAGDVTSWTHPAGFTVTNTVNAAQEITQIQSSLVDASHPQYLAKNITYTPWGAEATLENGCASTYGQEIGCTDTVENYQYSNRLQAVMIELGNASNAAADYCLVYNYYAGAANPTSCTMPGQGTNDNGDVAGVFYQDNADSSLSHAATYWYDAVNRLTGAAASGNSTYAVNFTYDGYGNRTCVTNGPAGPTGGPNLYCFSAVSYSSATNRITNSGYTYDAAGDLTSDGTNTYQYDAEGREISANGPSNWAAAYNAFGQVVQRYLASQGETDSFLWNPSGQLTANWTQNHGWWWDELAWANGSPVSDNRQLENTVWFLHSDSLGSTRGVTTSAGQLMWGNLDYPWGQDWAYAGSNWGFFAGMGLGWSALGQIETPHRNYVPGLGRWMSPDPLGGDITNPQSLNRYAYVLNNPTTLTDPSGLGDPNCNDPWFSNSHAECPGPPPCVAEGSEGCIPYPIGYPVGGGGGSPSAGPSTAIISGSPVANMPALGFQSTAVPPIIGPGIFDSPWIIRIIAWGWPIAAISGEVASRVVPLVAIGANVLLMKSDVNPAQVASNATKFPTIEEVRRNCTPVGGPIIEPSSSPSRPGWTSEEQEYDCRGVRYTIHCLVSPTGASRRCHLRPGSPKGGLGLP